jgi:hypothetical protein
MSNSDDSGLPVKAEARSLTSYDEGQNQLKLKATEKAIDAAADAVGVLLEGGRVFLDRERVKTKVAEEWEKTHQSIASMDATTRNILQQLEGEMKKVRDRTDRLQMVLGTIDRLGNDMPDTLAIGFQKALDNLTREV